MRSDPSEILGEASSLPTLITQPVLLSVGLRTRDRVATLLLSGELDMASSPLVEEWLSKAEGGKKSCIVVDLEQLTFIDCSGLRPLMQAEARACSGGWVFRLVNAGGPVRKVLSVIWPKILLDEIPDPPAIAQETALPAHRDQDLNPAANGRPAFA